MRDGSTQIASEIDEEESEHMTLEEQREENDFLLKKNAMFYGAIIVIFVVIAIAYMVTPDRQADIELQRLKNDETRLQVDLLRASEANAAAARAIPTSTP